MIIAQGHDLEQQFGANTLFKNVTFSIDSNARIGLVGPNGVGKTTLLKIMTGEQEPTHGEFTVNKGIDVGSCSPVIIFNRVVLPTPLGPTHYSKMLIFQSIPMPESDWLAPNCCSKSCPCAIIIIFHLTTILPYSANCLFLS